MDAAAAPCLKITEKVSFNIYVYILSGHKLIKNAKNGPFWRVFDNLKLAVKQCYQTGHLKKDKNWSKMPKLKNQMRHFESFSNTLLAPKQKQKS